MKKLQLRKRFIFMLFFSLLNICTIKAQKDSILYFGKDNDTIAWVKFKIYDTHIELTSLINRESGTIIKLPDSIDNKPITKIGDNFFNRGFRHIIFYMPCTIEEIGNNAFFCADDVDIKDFSKSRVRKIGDSAFSGCQYLRFDGKWNFLTFPKTVEEIGTSCFASNRHLESVTLPPTLKIIPDGAFASNKELKSCILPDSIESIGESAFCNTKIDVKLPPKLKSIGGHAFRGTHISKITIPNTVTKIGAYAFWDCKYLNEVIFDYGSELSTIEEYTFYGCTKLNKISIPNSIVKIGDFAFAETALTTINFPEKLQYIGDYAFRNTSIKEVIIPDCTTHLGEGVFKDCESLSYVSLPTTLKYIPDDLFNGCRTLSSIVLPSTITSIGKEAFWSCPLDSINLPNGLMTIGESAFLGTNLRTIVIPASVTSIGKKCLEIGAYGEYPNWTTYLDNIILESKEYLDLSNAVSSNFIYETLYPLNLIVPYHLRAKYDARNYKLIRGSVSAYDVNAIRKIVSNQYYHFSNKNTGQYLQLSSKGSNETSLISEGDMNKSAGAQIRLIESGTVNKYYMTTQEMSEPILVTLNYKGDGCPKEHPAFWKWNILVDGKYLAVDSNGNFVYTDVADSNADWYIAPANTINLEMFDGHDGKSYATVYYPFDVKISTEKTHIYVAEQTDDNYVYLSEIDDGVLKKGNAALVVNDNNSDFVEFYITSGASNFKFNNLFKGTCQDYFNINAEDEMLILDYRNEGLGFYAPSTPVIKANKAYLERNDINANVSKLQLFFKDETNGIHDINNKEFKTEDEVIYDMQGRKMQNVPNRGAYIKNGKLHIK